MTRAIVAWGSNIAPERHGPLALDALEALGAVLDRFGPVPTRAIGMPDAADFQNGAVLIETNLDATALRAALKAIEVRLGRPPGAGRWAPRTIDLDVIVWDGRVVDPDVARRDYLRAAVRALWPSVVVDPAGP